MKFNNIKRSNKSKLVAMKMKKHYSKVFSRFGSKPRGVDWGSVESTLLRYGKMLAVIEGELVKPNAFVSLLDVGCGYGELFKCAKNKDLKLRYTGIDVAPKMISWARKNIIEGKFIKGDFLQHNFEGEKFDYVVCNGILTQKLDISILDMDKFAKELIKKMFSLSSRGIAFNIMTTYVNYFVSNLYYKHPSEILTYCLSDISHKVKIDHSYGLYEYTVYIYK